MDSEHHLPQDDANCCTVSRLLTGLAVGGVATGAAIILAPHVLPLLGIGSSVLAGEAMFLLHGTADATGNIVGSGLAGTLNQALSAVPLVGDKLAAGGIFNAAATALTGIGGVLLGNHIAKKFHAGWGKAIKYAALATSALIALPTVLTALSVGVVYLSTISMNAESASHVVGFIDSTLGSIGHSESDFLGLSGAAATLPHFLTCGLSIVPAGLAFALSRKDPAPHVPFTERLGLEGAAHHIAPAR